MVRIKTVVVTITCALFLSPTFGAPRCEGLVRWVLGSLRLRPTNQLIPAEQDIQIAPRVIEEFEVIKISRKKVASSATIETLSKSGSRKSIRTETLEIGEDLSLFVGLIENPSAESSFRAYVFIERPFGRGRFAVGTLEILRATDAKGRGVLRYTDNPEFLDEMYETKVLVSGIYELSRSFIVTIARGALLALRQKHSGYFKGYSLEEFTSVFPEIY